MTLTEAPILAPGEVQIDATQIAEMQAELENAQNMELPEDDDFWEVTGAKVLALLRNQMYNKNDCLIR